MILGESSVQRGTHYEILSVKEGASYEEIRSGYRSAILNSHPDKTPDSSAAGDEKFLRVQKAWEILSDSRSRAAYNNELRASRRLLNARVWEDIDLMDVGVTVVEEAVVELCYDCRCGDCFSVDSSDLERMGYKLLMDCNNVWFESPAVEENDGAVRTSGSVVIPCGSCSLQVRLSIDTGLKVPIC